MAVYDSMKQPSGFKLQGINQLKLHPPSGQTNLWSWNRQRSKDNLECSYNSLLLLGPPKKKKSGKKTETNSDLCDMVMTSDKFLFIQGWGIKKVLCLIIVSKSCKSFSFLSLGRDLKANPRVLCHVILGLSAETFNSNLIQRLEGCVWERDRDRDR